MKIFTQRTGSLMIILALAFALRVGVSNRSLWLDEADIYWQATETKRVPTGMSYSLLDVNLIKPFIGRWDEPWMLRLPFIILGTASILFFSLAVREFMGNNAAKVFAVLLAISPFHIYYSSELRMYVFVLLGSAINFFFFLRAQREGGWTNWFGYCAGAVIGLYGHFFVSLLHLVQGIYLLTDPIRRKILPKWFLLQLVIITAVIPAFLAYHRGL